MKEIKDFKKILAGLYNISECPNFSDDMRNHASELHYYIYGSLKPDIGVTAQEAMDNAIGGWTDLDIDNLPERFFTRDDIELQFKLDSLLVTDWVNCQLEKNGRSYVIKRLTGKEVFKYRYRIQEKKPIQITRDIAEKIMKPHKAWTKKDYEHVLGLEGDRKVIIID